MAFCATAVYKLLFPFTIPYNFVMRSTKNLQRPLYYYINSKRLTYTIWKPTKVCVYRWSVQVILLANQKVKDSTPTVTRSVDTKADLWFLRVVNHQQVNLIDASTHQHKRLTRRRDIPYRWQTQICVFPRRVQTCDVRTVRKVSQAVVSRSDDNCVTWLVGKMTSL